MFVPCEAVVQTALSAPKSGGSASSLGQVLCCGFDVPPSCVAS